VKFSCGVKAFVSFAKTGEVKSAAIRAHNDKCKEGCAPVEYIKVNEKR